MYGRVNISAGRKPPSTPPYGRLAAPPRRQPRDGRVHAHTLSSAQQRTPIVFPRRRERGWGSGAAHRARTSSRSRNKSQHPIPSQCPPLRSHNGRRNSNLGRRCAGHEHGCSPRLNPSDTAVRCSTFITTASCARRVCVPLAVRAGWSQQLNHTPSGSERAIARGRVCVEHYRMDWGGWLW